MELTRAHVRDKGPMGAEQDRRLCHRFVSLDWGSAPCNPTRPSPVRVAISFFQNSATVTFFVSSSHPNDTPRTHSLLQGPHSSSHCSTSTHAHTHAANPRLSRPSAFIPQYTMMISIPRRSTQQAPFFTRCHPVPHRSYAQSLSDIVPSDSHANIRLKINRLRPCISFIVTQSSPRCGIPRNGPFVRVRVLLLLSSEDDRALAWV